MENRKKIKGISKQRVSSGVVKWNSKIKHNEV